MGQDLEAHQNGRQGSNQPLDIAMENVNETALLSEFSLAKDWNTPEEDEAWMDLDILPDLSESSSDEQLKTNHELHQIHKTRGS